MGKPLLTIRPGLDVYQLYLAAATALRKADLQDQAYELLRRGQEAPSHLHLMDLVAEFVELERGEMRVHPEGEAEIE